MGGYPFEGNWCWIGLKDTCHNKLKQHVSWAQLQDIAARHGTTPPRANEQFSPLLRPEVCDRPWFGASESWTVIDRVVAHEWFKNHVAVYVLNLPQDTERWKTISARLKSLQIRVTRISGVDMRNPGALWTAKKS